jgi:hypothetical protein
VRTIAAVVSLLLFLTVGLGVLMIAGVAAYMETESKGYVDFTSEGISLKETVLEKDGQKVRLIAMMHIGEPQFYRSLFASFEPGSLVLSEGVSDKQNRLSGSFSYRRVAEALGLERQPQLDEVTDEVVEEPSASSDQAAPQQPAQEVPAQQADPAPPPPPVPAANSRPDIVRADVDLSELSETTIRILMAIGELYASDSLGEAASRYFAMTSNFTEDDFRIFVDEIVNKRNARVLDEFDQRRSAYTTIIIPWGGLHMPGLEAALVERGFHISSQQQREVLRYETIGRRFSQPQVTASPSAG